MRKLHFGSSSYLRIGQKAFDQLLSGIQAVEYWTPLIITNKVLLALHRTALYVAA